MRTSSVVDVDDPDRGTGRSTRQLKRLPQGAWFFSDNPEYHQHLARSNGRWDIKVKHVSLLKGQSLDALITQRVIACDVDHDASMDDEQQGNYKAFQARTALP